MIVERLGFTLVKGLAWNGAQRLQVTASGVTGDRAWSPVRPDLTCLRATDFPSMVAMTMDADELPRPSDLIFDGRPQEVRYYQRRIPATIHRGALAERISDWAGEEVWLARSVTDERFIWSSPVSVLLRSELAHLPGDVDRYRANIVLDDREAPLQLAPGSRLHLGSAELKIEGELERCIVVNHHPLTGAQDHSLLKRLRPGVKLAFGCRVVTPGEVRVGDAIA